MGMCGGIQFPESYCHASFSTLDDSNTQPVAHTTQVAAPKKVVLDAAVPAPAAKPQAAPAAAGDVIAVALSPTPVGRGINDTQS